MKKILSFLILHFTLLAAFALPGINSYIPDSNGEFVYYRDYTFERESYIGLLRYNQSSYKMKYYAPADLDKQLAEKEISFMFAVNSESNFLDITGEIITSTISPNSEDVDIMNYLRDLLYDFSSHRIKKGEISPSSKNYTLVSEYNNNGIKSKEVFDQFGGDVTVVYDVLVPFFNIKSIYSKQGDLIFNLSTVGVINANSNSAFEDFKGFNYSIPKIKRKIPAEGKAVKIETPSKGTLTLDKNWENPLASIWTYGDLALIATGSIDNITDDAMLNKLTIVRSVSYSTADNYKNFETMELIFRKNGEVKILAANYSPSEKNEQKNIIVLSPADKSTVYLSLNVYSDVYEMKPSYFNKIINTYKAK